MHSPRPLRRAMEYVKVLITIGNDAYDPCPEQGNWGALKGSVNDSRKIGDHCRATGDWLVYSFENVTEAEFKSSAKQASSRVTQETSVVAFHYSGHAVDSEGKTWLIPVIDNEDPDKQGKGNKVNPVSLDTLLHALCKNISPSAKLIVLIDGCRSEPEKEPSEKPDEEPREKPPPIHWLSGLAKPDFLQIYACLPGSEAHEIDLASGCTRGRLSMVLLNSMRECESLSSLIGQVTSEVEKLGKFRSKQKPCIYHTWDYSSTPNFFRKTKLHVPDIVKQIEDECRGQHLRARQELEKKLQEANMEVYELTSQKCQLEEECTKMEQALQILEKNKDTNKEEILRLKRELTEKYRELREKEDELKDKTFEFECLQKRLVASKERLKEAEDARTKLEKREHACVPQESYLQMKQEMHKLREENSKLKQQIADEAIGPCQTELIRENVCSLPTNRPHSWWNPLGW